MTIETIQYDDFSSSDILREAFLIPDGFQEEIWYDKEKELVFFSAPMTNNSWSETDDDNLVCIGHVDAADLSDYEDYFQIDDDWAEISDDNHETHKDFDDKDYERYYTNSSIIPLQDAIDILCDSCDEMDWYEDVFDNLRKARNEDDDDDDDDKDYYDTTKGTPVYDKTLMEELETLTENK